MKHKHSWLVISALVVIGLLVAACGQSPAAAPPQNSVPAQAEQPAEAAVQPPETDEAEDKAAPQAEAIVEAAPQKTPVQGLVWVANGIDDSLSAIDLATNQVVTTHRAGQHQPPYSEH